MENQIYKAALQEINDSERRSYPASKWPLEDIEALGRLLSKRTPGTNKVARVTFTKRDARPVQAFLDAYLEAPFNEARWVEVIVFGLDELEPRLPNEVLNLKVQRHSHFQPLVQSWQGYADSLDGP